MIYCPALCGHLRVVGVATSRLMSQARVRFRSSPMRAADQRPAWVGWRAEMRRPHSAPATQSTPSPGRHVVTWLLRVWSHLDS